MKTHSKPWKCEVCSQGFALRADLHRHTKSKHLVGHLLSICKECGRDFTRKDNLDYHINKYHATEPRFTTKCPSVSIDLDKAAKTLPDWLALTQSASTGNLNSVDRLIKSGCNINSRADDGSTALHCAARAGQAAVLELLIERGADVNARNRRGRIPVFEAIIGRDLDCIVLLLKAGTDTTKLWSGDGPQTLSGYAAQTSCKIMREIIEATPESQRCKVVLSLATDSARIGQVAMLRYLHTLEGITLKTQAGYLHPKSIQPNPLHYAVQNGHSAAVEYLLHCYKTSGELGSLLKMATRRGRTDVCKLLLTGSSLTHIDDALCIAAQLGHLPIIKAILIYRAAVSVQGELNLRRPILAALWNDNLKSLRYLVSYDQGAHQLVEKQSDGLPRVELVKYLFQSKKLALKDEGNIHFVKWRHNGTLLHLAVEHSDLDLATYVIQHESFDSSTLERRCNWEGNYWSPSRTALDFAQYRGETEIASLLIAHGAINHNIAPKKPPQSEQNPAQPSSPDSDSDHEMHDSGDSDTDTETDTDS